MAKKNSYGVLVFKNTSENERKFLMVRRHFSFAYEELIRGKYVFDPNDVKYIGGVISRLTQNEFNRVRSTNNFNVLWDEINIKFGHTNRRCKNYNVGKSNFRKLKSKAWKYLTDDSLPIWTVPEWGFPKGKKKRGNEAELTCAIRELKEETELDINDDTVILNTERVQIIDIADNGEEYNNQFYFARSTVEELPSVEGNSEVSETGWFSYDEANNLIRNYHSLIKDALNAVDSISRGTITTDNLDISGITI